MSTTTHLDAVVTIPLHALEELKADLAAHKAKVEQLTQDVVDAKLGGPEATARLLYEALLDGLPVIGFAIASLPPLAVRGWPYKELRAFVQKLVVVPGAPVAYAEVKNDFLMFAAECERWEKARAEGTEKEMFAEETARRAVGPTNIAPEDDLLDLDDAVVAHTSVPVHSHLFVNGACACGATSGG